MACFAVVLAHHPMRRSWLTNRNLRWYEIDAGGLSQVRLRTHPNRALVDRGSFVVRRSSVQYEVDPGGLSWTSRMVVQPPPDLQLPPLQIVGTTVTSVKVNANDVPFTSKIVGGQVRQLQLEKPPGLSGSETIAVNVTVSGYSTWSSELGWCDLPKPVWVGTTSFRPRRSTRSSWPCWIRSG